MSVSYFAALESQVPAVEARAIMASAQAAVYPHVSKEGAQRMWQAWARAAYPPPPTPTGRAASQFYLNDRPVSIFELRRGLGQALGAGLTA